MVDIVFILVFTIFGGLLGLIVEAQRHLYPIYLAFILLFAAKVLDLFEKVITPNADK